MTGRDDPLQDALLDLESSAPADSPPPSRAPTDRRTLWALAGAVAVAAVLAGVVIGNSLSDRRDVGEASPTASTASTSAGPSVAPTSAPESTPTPSAPSTPAPEPTLAPRTGWSVVPSDALEEIGRLDGVVEVAGRLFALGSDIGVQPMIWFSDDGETWHPAQVDDVPSDLGGQVKALVDAGDRLVAVATLGFAQGSGPFGTSIYTSEDGGQTWLEAESTPGQREAALFDVVRSGARIVAAGSHVWTSDDGGRTWTDSTPRGGQEGAMRSIDGGEDLLLAAGMVGTDLVSPPALAWVSGNRGDTWERMELSEEGGATGALVTASGELLVAGYDAGSEHSLLWSSTDDGAHWTQRELAEVSCCSTGLVETPSGIVIGIGSTESTGVVASSDGQSWSFEAVDFRLREVAWSPTFGLLAITENSEVVLGPQPYP